MFRHLSTNPTLVTLDFLDHERSKLPNKSTYNTYVPSVGSSADILARLRGMEFDRREKEEGDRSGEWEEDCRTVFKLGPGEEMLGVDARTFMESLFWHETWRDIE